MEHLTYEDYKDNGGVNDYNAFLLLLVDCEAIMNKYTFGRINELDTNIKRCMVKIMDGVIANDKNGLTSYSNGIESFGFADNTEEGREKAIKTLISTYLPKELTYRGVK